MSDLSPSLQFLDNLPPLREIIAQYDLRAKKSLGQNFLLDGNITDKIAAIPQTIQGYTVFEIGPGPGGLTRSLLRAGADKVVAIEYDDKAVTALQDLRAVCGDRLEVLHGDALETNLLRHAPDAKKRGIVANLPYNVATPLLLGWLRQIDADMHAYDFMALMFQREVADRITAQPATKAYGRLAVMAQWLCRAGRAYDLPASAFTPPPKVDSAVVLFEPKDRSSVKQPRFDVMEKLLAQAFGQRRKMIRASLRSYMPAIEACGLEPTLRAENLTVSDYVALALEVGCIE